MVMFPDERSLEHSADGTDLIRPGCSVGFNRILGFFKAWAGGDTQPKWDMFLLNGATIFRNNFDPKKSQAQIYEDFQSDCEMFTLYYEAYLSFCAPPGTRIPIVVYIPDYSAIPATIAREASPREIEMSRAFMVFQAAQVKLGARLLSAGPFTDRWIIPAGSRQRMPQRDLVDWIHKGISAKQLGSFRWGASVGMVTHCAVDLHMHVKVPRMSLLESYTGIIKPPNQFGTKLVNDKGVLVPFNKLTHRIFGDPIHIRPAVTGRKRTELKKMAVANNWFRKSDTAIYQDVRSVDPNIKNTDLTNFTF